MIAGTALLLNTMLVERLVLLANHVLASDEQATRRLAMHNGRVVQIELLQWPLLLPRLPLLVFRITAAGLVEWCGTAYAGIPDARVEVDAGNPAAILAKAVAGAAPRFNVEGDAPLAGDIAIALEQVRWDVRDDLSKLVGPALAYQLSRFGSLLLAGLSRVAKQASGIAARTAQPRGG